MMNKITVFTIMSLITLSIAMPQAFAFDINAINVTLSDAQVDEYDTFDIITAVFSIFNNDTQSAHFEGPNMLYLNDTNADWWEYSNAVDLEGYSETDCPSLDVVINPGNSTEVKLCYLVQHDSTIGYSLITNNNTSFMDMSIHEIQLEYVPEWFKTTAASWCSNAITESQFITLAQNNIQDEIIKVMRGQTGTDFGVLTPEWVKNNACLWSTDQISDYEFLDGLYWLIDNGKIQLN